MSNFKTFKIVLLATVNSVIVTASLLLKFYTVLVLKIYDQRTQLDSLIKDVIISRNIVFERVKRLRGCSSDVFSSYFFRPSKVWSMLHHWSGGRVQNKIKEA